MVRQNYQIHLKTHPGEDDSDLREAGQGRLSWGSSTRRIAEFHNRTEEGGGQVRERSRSPCHPLQGEEEERAGKRRCEEEREESLHFDCVEGCKKEERSGRLELILEQISWDVLLQELKMRVADYLEKSRKQLLETSALLLEVQRCLNDKDRQEEEREVVRMLRSVISQLGWQGFRWSGLLDCEAEVLQQLITNSDLCPDLPLFLQRSYVFFLDEVKKKDIKTDKNSNETKESSRLEDVNLKLDEVVKKLSLEDFDVSECDKEEEAVMKKIRFIKSTVDVSKNIQNLEKAVEAMKVITGTKKDDEKEISDDREEVIRKCRSIEELCQIPEFKYVEDESVMVCEVCQTKFKYHRTLEQNFIARKISPQFSHLKQVLKTHIKSGRHLKDRGIYLWSWMIFFLLISPP